jgi:hypothetical protein
VRDARDPQAMFNFWRSASTELVALAPRAPWLIPQGGIPNNDAEMQKWATANTRSHAYLTYNASAGPMPQRQPFAGVPAGALQEALNASDDMKAVMGIFDASLGARSNETSGRAIMARQREADVGTFHFVDNLARGIQEAASCLIEIIPALYSERDAITILGEDEAETVVRVARTVGEAPSADDPDGKIYNLAAGRYDVTVKVGPSYATQREETVTALMEMARTAPQTMVPLADMMVKNMDWPGSDEAAKRLQFVQMIELFRAVPPQIVAQLPPDTPGLPPIARQIATLLVQQQAPPAMPGNPMIGAPPGALPVFGGV